MRTLLITSATQAIKIMQTAITNSEATAISIEMWTSQIMQTVDGYCNSMSNDR